MYAQENKSKVNGSPTNKLKSRSVANSDDRKKSSGKQGFGFVDNRPEAVAQRKGQWLLNGKRQVEFGKLVEERIGKKTITQQAIQQKIKNDSQPNKLGVSILQRATKWWSTNEDHTEVTSEESAVAPDGSYVKRDKAGESDKLLSTEDQAWNSAKATAVKNRPDNTELFEGTTEKMVTGDGNRTYLTKKDSKKAVSIIVTHTTDPQSQVETEKGETIKVKHAHSAIGIHAKVKKDIKAGKVPKYTNDNESKVHYLSLTQQ